MTSGFFRSWSTMAAPPLGTLRARYCGGPRGSGAVVAHHLAKVRVAGSNPVFRSIVAVQRRFCDPLVGTRDRPTAIWSPDGSSDHTAIHPSSIATKAADRNRDAATNESDASRGAAETGSDSIPR